MVDKIISHANNIQNLRKLRLGFCSKLSKICHQCVRRIIETHIFTPGPKKLMGRGSNNFPYLICMHLRKTSLLCLVVQTRPACLGIDNYQRSRKLASVQWHSTSFRWHNYARLATKSVVTWSIDLEQKKTIDYLEQKEKWQSIGYAGLI